MASARVWAPVCLLLLTQCSAGKGDSPPVGSQLGHGGQSTGEAGAGAAPSTGGADATGGTGLQLGGSAGSGNSTAGSGGGDDEKIGCGDGVLQAAKLGEVCDDGNSESGDGCSADCKVVEENYSCL